MSSPKMIIQKSTCDLLRVDRLPQTGVRMPYGTPTEKKQTITLLEDSNKSTIMEIKILDIILPDWVSKVRRACSMSLLCVIS